MLRDTLDMMYIMGRYDDFEDAIGFVGNLTSSMPSVCPSYFLALSHLPFHFSPSSVVPSSSSPLPSFHFFHLPDLNSSAAPPRPTSYAHFFETVIRYLGRLFSAHAHSSPILRSKADLGGCSCLCLIPLWGLPLFPVNTDT